MKYVDLSHPIREDLPIYPGDPKVQIRKAGILDKDGYQDHYISIGTHAGTHIDAPAHMLKEGKTLENYSPDKFIGRGVLIEVGLEITLEQVKNAQIEGGDIVLFYTGMSKKYYDETYFTKYPAIPEKVAHYLVKKRVKMVGVDTCSVDHEEFVAHKTLLEAEILIIENLANLNQLTGKEFTVIALPLNLKLDGSPARVIAEVS